MSEGPQVTENGSVGKLPVFSVPAETGMISVCSIIGESGLMYVCVSYYSDELNINRHTLILQ